MKLAFSTNAYLKFSFPEAVRRLAKIGYAGVEIMADVPQPLAGLSTQHVAERGMMHGIMRTEIPMSQPEFLARMVERIVMQFAPEKIILFGSHARGEAGPDSDVDLLVVMPVSGSVRDKRLEIRQSLRDFTVPLDIIVTRPEDFAWRKEIVGTIEWPAAQEGKVLYARP